MKRLVIDGRIQVFDENVSRASLSDRRISIRPHDTNRMSTDQSIVESFQSLYCLKRLVSDFAGSMIK